MPNGQQQDQFYGTPIKIFDFSKGLWTVKPEMLLPSGASPYLKNVWYDEKGALSKMPGTELLLTEANNEFSNHQCYNLFVYHTPTGQQILIYQGMNSGNTAMSLFSLAPQTSYPASVAMTDITPPSGLTLYKKCDFANYGGRLFVVNGTDNLKLWTGSIWGNRHKTQPEQFKYICVYDACLFQAWSAANPNRIIFTAQGSSYFNSYYHDPWTYYRDFPTTEGDYINGINVSPKGSLLVWKRNSIHEVIGSPVNDTDVKKVISINRGTIDISGVQVLGDIVIFPSDDGLYMLGNRSVIVSAEDQKLQTEASVKPLTAEIRNFWKDNFTLPDLNKIKEKTWAGYSDWCASLTFVNGTDASNFKADDVGIEEGDKITGVTSTETGVVVYVDLTSGSWTGGDAAGTLYLTNVSGTFDENSEDINIGSTKFAETADPVAYVAGWIVSGGQINRPSITTNPDVINSQLKLTSYPHTISNTAYQTTQDQYVNLRSEYGKNAYFSQQFELDDATIENPICSGVLLWFKEIGDVSGDTIKVYITSENDDDIPDFDEIYAEGKLNGDFLHGVEELSFDAGESEIYIGETINGATSNATGVVHKVVITSGKWTDSDAAGNIYIKGVTGTWQDGEDIRVVTTKHAVTNTGVTADSSPISTGCWVFCEMDYWDYPQNMYDGNLTAQNEVHIAIKTTGDDSSNYIQWGYNSAGGYADGMMVNSDSETPSGQADLDYTFKVCCSIFYSAVTVYTTSFQADSVLENWDNVYVVLDEATINDYTRNSYLSKIEYEIRSADSGWGTWTETTNGGVMTGTNRWLRLKLTFYRSTGSARVGMDSLTLRSVRVSYIVQDLTEKLISSVIDEDRYWFTCKMVDPETSGNCLDFDGNDDVWINDSDTLDMGTSDFAVEFWIKGTAADQGASYSPIIGNWAGYHYVTGDHGWNISITKADGKLRYHIDDSATCDTMTVSPNLLNGDPHYVAVNFDRNDECTAWVDNVEIGGTYDISAASTSDLSNDLTFLLGAAAIRINAPDEWEINNWYDGKLKQLKLYKGRLLTTDDRTYNYANPTLCYSTTNLVAWWKCSEGMGNAIRDSSGNNNHGLRGNGIISRKPKWAVW